MTPTQLLRVVFSRKSALVGSGQQVGRLEAHLGPVTLGGPRLEQYRAVCGFLPGGVPLTWPHVLVSGLHLDMLSSPRFPVRLLGLVHLQNDLELVSPLDEGAPVSCHAWLEGHRETERGQEFELFTELSQHGKVAWKETTTFLARRKRTGPKPPPQTPAARPTPLRTVDFEAPSGLGRRYGRIAGDLNPIHLFDVTAKAFGFPRAIAHGMWSLARITAELSPTAPFRLQCQFKLPVLLPARLHLEVSDGAFVLLDERRERPHVTGTFSRG